MHRVAIHPSPGSFSDRWRDRCEELGVPYTMVDCRGSSAIPELLQHTALLWHWSHLAPTDLLMARQVLRAAELAGLRVFPNEATCWHFDDKIAQKYMLEALGAPLATTSVFFDRGSALAWAERAEFPQVFKLRRGAASSNVRLLRSKDEAVRLAHKAFGRGFVPVSSPLVDAGLRVRRARERRDVATSLRRAPANVRMLLAMRRGMPRERGYFYVQEFLANNEFDTRVTIIGGRAFTFTRNNRKGDFRASGSGEIVYDRDRIDPRCVQIAFETTRSIGGESCAFDFAFDERGQPRILEVSYAYQAKAVYDCSGYWGEDMKWHDGQMWPQDAILDDLLSDSWRPGVSGGDDRQ